MDTLNDVMTDLLIEQNDRLDETPSTAVLKGFSFVAEANNRENKLKLIVTGEDYADKN